MEQAGERSGFSDEKRRVLVEVLREQYANSEITLGGKLAEHVEMLLNPLSRTVVTGHQLCLFGGPLYVFYKLAHVVAQAEQLNALNPGFYTVPIFWMATEDHDLEEVDHVHMNGQRLHWQTGQSGAVGRMMVDDLEPVIAQLAAQLGVGKRAEKAQTVLRDAYRPGRSLAQSMRILAHHWLGHRGLVILDADDRRLKHFATELFERELLDSQTSMAVQAQSEALSSTYPVQAFVRPINLFYLSPGARLRIEHKIGGYQTADASRHWSASEIVEELHQHPDRFSPNVLLRPLYQETILPNIAYTGGAGELAYWFQLKTAFQKAGLDMPILILRQSFMWVTGRNAKVWNRSQLPSLSWFKPLDRFLKERLAEHSPFDFELESTRAEFNRIFDSLSELASQTDSSMSRAVEAERKRHQNALDRLSRRLIRAEKRRLEERVSQWERTHQSLFPKAGLQERFDSYWDVYAYFGDDVLDTVLQSIKAFESEFILIRSLE